MPKKLTHDEYIKRAREINSNIEVLGEYINSQVKILHRCKIDGYEWCAKPNAILNGKGCAMCYGNIKKTHEKYVEEVALINPNIEVIEKYINANEKILHRCKIDGYEWMSRPYSILSGQGCPKCAGHILKTHEQYIEELLVANPNIEVIGKYVNSHTKILHRCKMDGCEWMVQPNDVLQGYGCPRCAGNERYGHEEYIRRVSEISPNIEVVGVYIDNQTKILHRCKTDGCEWMPYPNHILRGCGCPQCNTSKGEKAIEAWIKKQNILYEAQKRFSDCRDKNPLPFDFYLPEYDICIEYQGQQHYESVEYFGGESKFKDQIKKDNIKKEYCQKNNIYLFEIPYYSNLDEELIRLYDFIMHTEKGVAV